MQCDVVNRVQVHPSVKIGGVSIGQCPKEALEGFVVCFEHVNKEALWMMVQHERRDKALLLKQIKALQKDVRPSRYKTKKPRETIKGLKTAVRKLKVSKPMQDILLQIAEELNGAWEEQFKMFKHSARRTNR